jgi:hypothetical protein
MKTKSKNVFRVRLQRCLPVLAFLMTSQAVMATDYPVKVYFTQAGCPELAKTIVTPLVTANGVDRVIWSGVYANDEPVTTRYQIYFDPFRGGNPLKSKSNGEVESPPVVATIPKGVEYKYTIISDVAGCLPRDPVVKVRS